MIEIVTEDFLKPEDVDVIPLAEPPVGWHNAFTAVNEGIRKHVWHEDNLQIYVSYALLFPELFVRTNGGLRVRSGISSNFAYEQVYAVVHAIQKRGWVCSAYRGGSHVTIKHPKDKTITLWERLRKYMGGPWLLL